MKRVGGANGRSEEWAKHDTREEMRFDDRRLP